MVSQDRQQPCPACNATNPSGVKLCSACGFTLTDPAEAAAGDVLQVGTKLQNGKYTVGKVLGRGGFGITYKGAVSATREAVAIKEFFPEGCRRKGSSLMPTRLKVEDYRDYVSKFLEEAKTLSRFDHAGIVKVRASFEANGTAYMVMEYLEGQTLKQKLDAGGRMAEVDAVACIKQVAAALEVVHGNDMLHRDVKPDNIILTTDGRVVLIDFGTAREFARGQTKTMTRMVTPGYAPLEQRSAHGKFGPFTDIYALGATLYCMLTGQAPVDALDRIQGVDIKHPRRIHDDISANVSAAVLQAMKLKAPQRPQTIKEFLNELTWKPTRKKVDLPKLRTTPRTLPQQIPDDGASRERGDTNSGEGMDAVDRLKLPAKGRYVTQVSAERAQRSTNDPQANVDDYLLHSSRKHDNTLIGSDSCSDACVGRLLASFGCLGILIGPPMIYQLFAEQGYSFATACAILAFLACSGYVFFAFKSAAE